MVARVQDSYRERASDVFSSETTWPIKAKFHIEPQWIEATKVCSLHLGHMTKMALMLFSGKNPLKVFVSETIGPMGLGLYMQHWGHGPDKV